MPTMNERSKKKSFVQLYLKSALRIVNLGMALTGAGILFGG
jgi:hypothetical protein